MPFENTPIAEAVSLGAARPNPWPLAHGVYSLVGSVPAHAVFLGGACALLLCAALTRNGRLVPAVLSVVLGIGIGLRDLLHGALVSGSDPIVSVFLWALFLVSLFSRFTLWRLSGTCFALAVWPALDPAWQAPFLVVAAAAVGAAFDGRPRVALELGASAAVAFVLSSFRPESGNELAAFIFAVRSPSDSLLRYLSGWSTPNFQVRRELFLAAVLAAAPCERRSFLETFGIAAVIVLAFISEHGAPALPVVCSLTSAIRMIPRADGIMKSPAIAAGATSVCCVLAVISALAFNEPRMHEAGAREVVPSLERFLEERRLSRSGRSLFTDYRMSPAFLEKGITPWLDARVLSAGAGPDGEPLGSFLADYERLVTVADGFDEILKRRGIQAIVFPDETPLLNVLRENADWVELARSTAFPVSFRGAVRMQPMTILVRRNAGVEPAKAAEHERPDATAREALS